MSYHHSLFLVQLGFGFGIFFLMSTCLLIEVIQSSFLKLLILYTLTCSISLFLWNMKFFSYSDCNSCEVLTENRMIRQVCTFTLMNSEFFLNIDWYQLINIPCIILSVVGDFKLIKWKRSWLNTWYTMNSSTMHTWVFST